MNILIRLIFCAILLIPSFCFAGGNLYVATTGTDNAGCGAIDAPCRTIQYTVTNKITDANGGWNIYLRGGTYQEHDISIPVTKTGTSGAWNSIQSYDGEWAIIDGQNACTQAILYNGPGGISTWANGHDQISNASKYWTIERLEFYRGGNTSTSFGYGLLWNFGPVKVRYCYFHGNRYGNPDENPAALGGVTWQNSIIEYNYFTDNITASTTGNVAHLMNMASFIEYHESAGYPNTESYRMWKNEIRYNRFYGGGVAIRTKGAAWLDDNDPSHHRTSANVTNQEYGDKIHHNIIQQTSTSLPALFYQQDYVQIYNNIVDQTDMTKSQENWPIAVRRVRTQEHRDQLWPVIYNNTIYNGADSTGGFHEDDGSAEPRYYIYNNIFYQVGATSQAQVTVGLSTGFFDYGTGQIDPTYINIDRNYHYQPNETDIIFIGNVAFSTGGRTAAEWESYKGGGTNIYTQNYDAGNLLFQGTSGADTYRVRSTHTIDGSTTIANGGIGGTHPYKSGVTIPSYIGAANPSDDGWVAGVLALNSSYFTSATNGSTPSWVEGGSGDTTAPTVTISTTDPSSIISDSLSVTGTASDAVGVSSCKWRLSSAPDADNGTACTGTTSWTCSASGFSRGANTLYVGCGDAAGNWGSDSMVVNYLPTIQGVTGLGVSFR